MSLTNAGFVFILLLGLELIYFRIAKQFNIIDKPNHRSSHSVITIRGGGVIFPIAVLLCPIMFGLQYPYFLSGLFIISVVSFADDVYPLSNKLRIAIHLIAALLLIMQLDVYTGYFYLLPLLLFLIIGVINAVNFMDGINGITGLYALSVLMPLYYLNTDMNFVNHGYLVTAGLSVLVFGVFNFRARALCFAGDAGSVGIAFIIVFFLLLLILKTQEIKYLFFMLIYGLDAGTTIFFRVLRKENIGQAHRTHFYQFLANERKIPHMVVSSGYAFFQLIINFSLIKMGIFTPIMLVLFLFVSAILFILLRFAVEGRSRLLKTN